MNSLPSINPVTITKIKVALNAYGQDAEFLAKFVEALMKINLGTGYGKITVQLMGGKIVMMRAEETHSFEKIEEQRFDNY